MKMKKFVVGLVASALMIASMATTALAASPSTKTVTPTPKASTSTSTSTKKSAAEVYASNISGDIIKYDETDVSFPAILKPLSDATIASAKAQGTGGILKAVD